ncbi:translation elongation factor 4 [Nitrospina gracilis]|uniref:translation elongation factor 4 n=1 Tax=Nitrospina gracilis TaxID=35801 RepID=UPI001F01A90E|nr:translation elongation factor 4 [Nitrospina gracilis]MCF8719791.1 GTP-binding protein LepA [Nitrospina gracilis Nb-211]
MNQQHVRNFSIIAHIDHGKSTLADKLILKTGALEQRVFKDQYLDNMDLERERGITIKAQTVRLPYRTQKGDNYTFNMIDTPGHVDFSYEVSRSLAACEGVLLLIDASQGIQAQTIANVNLAMAGNLTIIPVINKVDLPSADPDMVREQLEDILQIDSTEAILASAKQGIGVDEIMEAIVERIPPPKGDPDKPLKALLFDAWYDLYKGVMILVRVVDGHLKEGMTIQMMATGHTFEVEELGAFTPVPKRIDSLSAGEVGFVIAGIKKLDETKIGDTVTEFKNNCAQPLPGYKDVKPMVFSGLYPIDGDQYENLRDALKKLRLNDASFTYEPETSAALGFGFRCGFLGLLHMEIVRERLEREYNVDLLTTAPTVVFHLKPEHGETIIIDNPSNLKKQDRTDTILEPYLLGTIIVPDEFVGVVMGLTRDRRGIQLKMEYLTPKTVMLQYALPFSEIVFDFFDHLKSATKGYASFDYEFLDFRASDLVKLDILFNGETVDALSMIVHRDKAYYRGRELVKKLKEQIPRQMFEVAIQASIGGKVIARESVKALRKNVLAKCYGGDITRKRKLLEKQKAGKKRMKQIGKVEIPQEAFLAVLRTDVK